VYPDRASNRSVPKAADGSRRASVGIVGTGFVARTLARALLRTTDLGVAAVLTRRSIPSIEDFPVAERLTRSLDDLLDKAELIVECSGDPRHAADVVAAAFQRGHPVVTMNSEFHVTCGSHFVGKGYLTEAEGDQPGALAALAEDARAMGFEPLVYGNMKGFLDRDPSPDSMRDWARRFGFSLEQVTSFTDGTKLQFEQALVANGLGASIAQPGMLGLAAEDRLAAQTELARRALELGSPLSDYIVHSGLPPGVFVAARHDDTERETLRTYKLGPGPSYVLERPFHLCALEISKTIRRALRGDPPLLHNSAAPTISVAAIAKRDLAAGHRIRRGMGGFDLRGEAVIAAESPGHLPIGIVHDAVLVHPVAAGCRLSWKDAELPDCLAVRIARSLFQ
jgi:predicted homoserine dehydrogenase-like protein